MSDPGSDSDQRRDKLLLRLLKTPPQARDEGSVSKAVGGGYGRVYRETLRVGKLGGRAVVRALGSGGGAVTGAFAAPGCNGIGPPKF